MTDCIKNLIFKTHVAGPKLPFFIFRSSLEIAPVGFLGIFTRGILGCDCGLAKNLHSSQNRGAVWSLEKVNSLISQIEFQKMLSEFLSYL
jgi:hypothetical protein